MQNIITRCMVNGEAAGMKAGYEAIKANNPNLPTNEKEIIYDKAYKNAYNLAYLACYKKHLNKGGSSGMAMKKSSTQSKKTRRKSRH